MKTKRFNSLQRIIGYIVLMSLLFFAGCGRVDTINNQNKIAAGEFGHRKSMAEKRLTDSQFKPVFKESFVLADVNINYDDPRRFYNYSGDLSGRYIEVLSLFSNREHFGKLEYLVKQILDYQQEDGRFGNPNLEFIEEKIGREHMPLLWGNGRLLVGLLEYQKHFNNPEVLHAARRLGDFFLNSYMEVTPAVSKRLEGLGADGIICFTQYVEGLVMLSVATGDPKYAETAARVYPMLPSRGTLHTHGYLTTLRGVLRLYEYDDNQKHFDFVKNAYQELINSEDYTLFGSVKEYFGGKGDRDEGCSTADFIRLTFQMYELTEDTDYLDRAEFAIYNALYFNQYYTGDFGHHAIDFKSTHPDYMHTAWWCCTMHGLRAMQEVNNEHVTISKTESVFVNLYFDLDFENEDLNLSIRRGLMKDDFHSYNLTINKISGSGNPLNLRIPHWASDAKVFLNEKEMNSPILNNYFQIKEHLKPGDVIKLQLRYKLRIITPDNKSILLSEVKSEPVSGALCYGPYIMSIDNKLDDVFLSEPNENYIYVHTIKNAQNVEGAKTILQSSFAGEEYLTANYKHGGFPSYYQTILRPISELTFAKHPYAAINFTFVPESALNKRLVDESMVTPWNEISENR